MLESQVSEKTPLFASCSKPTGRSQLHTLFTSCSGLLGTGANMVIMNLVLTVLIVESPTLNGLLNATSYLGMIFGYLFCGAFTDLVGPRIAGLTTAILGIAGAALAATAGAVMTLPTQLLIGRLVVGFAVGGEYPVSAITCKLKGGPHFTERQLLICCMVMQTIGNLSIQTLYLFLTVTRLRNDLIWRILLAAAGLPSLTCLFLRWDLNLHARAQSTRLPREFECSERRSYGSRLMTHFGEKWCPYLAALFASITAMVITNLNGVYTHVLVWHTVGDVVSHQQLLTYNGCQAAAQALMLVAGTLFAFASLEYMNIVCAQSMAMLVAASVMLLEALLGHQYPDLTLASAVFVQFPLGLTVATTYTILTETFPVEVAGAFLGIAGTISKCASVVATLLFPMSVNAYGLEMTQLAESIILLLGCIATLPLFQTLKRSSQKASSDSTGKTVSV